MTALYLPPDLLFRDARLDLSQIENLMLWPRDEQMRVTAFGVAAVEEMRLNCPPTITLDRELFNAVVSLPRLSDLQEKAKPRFLHGAVAGLRLWYLLCKLNVNTRLSFRKIDPEVCHRFNGFRISVKSIENTIWPEFKMVAHLWAAYIAISSANKNTAFPCKRADLPVFLSFAEEIRGLAMVKRAHGSSHPIVGPNVAISIAPEGLPRTKIQWDPGELYPSLFY